MVRVYKWPLSCGGVYISEHILNFFRDFSTTFVKGVIYRKKNIPQFLKTFYIKSLYKRLEFRLGTLTYDDLDRIKKKKKRVL